MKKILAILLTLFMLLPLGVSAQIIPQIPFTDIDSDAWYYSAVKYDYLNKLMNGTSGTTFSPDLMVSREMIVCVIANIEGIDQSEYNTQSEFIDVPAGRWYSAAIEWARQNSIVSGYGNGLFGLGNSLTREQCAQLLYQYAKYKNQNTDATDDLSQYADASQISSWAKPAMMYASSSKLFVGSNGKIMPKDLCSRAQLALLTYKFQYRLKYKNDIPDTKDADALTIKEGGNKRIVCWGDSLTASMGADTDYPRLVQQMTGLRTFNFGVGGETSELIAMRQGAMPVYAEPMTIPADTTPVPIDLVDDRGNPSDFGYFGTAGINKMTIAGVDGYLTRNGLLYYFTRAKAGKEVTITKRTRIITFGMKNRQENDIQVIFIGSNNRYRAKDADKLINIQKQMIAYSGTDKYVIVGFTAKPHMSEIAELNEALAKEYGDKFIDVREYMLTDALHDYNIVPTDQDLIDIASGEIPSSLRSDSVHGNQIFYEILAKMVVEKITELGYLN